jgi:hypothetical protein
LFLTKEMMLVHEVDKPGSDVDEFVDNLDALLLHKMELINLLRTKLLTFKQHLKEEDMLSKRFYEKKSEVMDIFDLKTDNQHVSNEMQLLDNLHEVMS